MESNLQIAQPQLQSTPVLLRPFHTDDAVDLFSLINDRVIAEFTRSIPYPYPEPLAAEWIANHESWWRTGKSAIFAICSTPAETADVGSAMLQSKPVLVGAIGLEIIPEHEHAELGYWIGRKFWNRGCCTVAGRLMLEFGFENLGLQRIHAHHMARNPASGRVLQKLGMSQEGLLRRHIKKWGRFEDIATYGILKTDWLRTKTSNH